MPPYPKHPSARARRNKSASSTELTVRTGPVTIPDLPPCFTVVKTEDENGKKVKTRVQDEWHPQAVKVWEEVWASEMSQEFLASDVGEMERLVALVHRFWVTSEEGSNTGLALMSAEIKALRKQYGLTPMARRSLDWTLAQTEESRSNVQRHRQPRQIDATVEDAEVVELTPSAPEVNPIAVLHK
jgi:hypothetical protein